MGRSLRLPSSTSPPSRNTMVRNPSHLGSKLQGPSGSPETGLASIGATGGITGRSIPPVSGTGLWAPAEVLGAGRAAQVAGVEAAVWAETIANFDDLSFLLLPRRGRRRRQGLERLAGPGWTDHRERLALPHLWDADHGRPQGSNQRLATGPDQPTQGSVPNRT